MEYANATPTSKAAESQNRSCWWNCTSGSKSLSEMHKKTPAEKPSKMPSDVLLDPKSGPTPKSTKVAPMGHIRANPKLIKFRQPADHTKVRHGGNRRFG